MRHAFPSLAVLLPLAACALSPEAAFDKANSGYGNFVNQQPSAYAIRLADEAVDQITTAYPPASTRFELQQKTPDSFGQHLVESLRARGYAVHEHERPPRTPQSSDNAASAPPRDQVGLTLRYIVDSAGSPSLYRLTMLVGEHSMTRAYLERDGALKPAGAWVRKE